MSKVNSQSQSGSSMYDSPSLPLLGRNGVGVLSEQTPAPVNGLQGQGSRNMASPSQSEVDVRAHRCSNAQGQAQVTKSNWDYVLQGIGGGPVA